MKKNIFVLLGVFLLANCTTIPVQEIPNPTVIESTEEQQQRYEQEWMENVKNITFESAYLGFADPWGGGYLAMTFWFVNGDLWDRMNTVDPDKHYILHQLLDKSYPIRFIDGKTAIMEMVRAASPALAGSLYIVRIKDGHIYRTADSRGFASKHNWDKKTVSLENLTAIGSKDPKINYLSETMITSGHDITYKKGTLDPSTIKWTTTDTINDDPNYDQFKIISFDSQEFYLNTGIPYLGNGDIAYKVPHKNIKYVVKVLDDKITEIKEENESKLPISGKLTTDMFIDMDYPITYTDDKNYKATLLWKGTGGDKIEDWQPPSTIKKITYDHASTFNIHVDTEVSYDMDNSLTISYDIPSGKDTITYTLTFENHRIKSLHKKTSLYIPPPVVGILNIAMFNDGTDRLIGYNGTSDVIPAKNMEIVKQNPWGTGDHIYTFYKVTYNGVIGKSMQIDVDTTATYKSPNDTVTYIIPGPRHEYTLTIVDDKVTHIQKE